MAGENKLRGFKTPNCAGGVLVLWEDEKERPRDTPYGVELAQYGTGKTMLDGREIFIEHPFTSMNQARMWLSENGSEMLRKGIAVNMKARLYPFCGFLEVKPVCLPGGKIIWVEGSK